MIRFRLELDVFRADHDLSLGELLARSRIRWHGVKPDRPDWSDHSHSLAVSLHAGRDLFLLLLNAWREPLEFELAELPAGSGGIDEGVHERGDVAAGI